MNWIFFPNYIFVKKKEVKSQCCTTMITERKYVLCHMWTELIPCLQLLLTDKTDCLMMSVTFRLFLFFGLRQVRI